VNSREQNARFVEWARSYDAVLWKIARSYAPAGEHEALHQDLLIALWHAAPLYRDEAKPSTFIYRVALNSAMNWSRSRTRYGRRHVGLDEGTAQVPAAQSEAEERERQVEQLYAALATLPDADRSIALLYLDELSYREIADVLGITESNVGVRLNRVKKRLMERLKKENQE
jgi:RNA polymerase sigma-70 factor, ECF subfamily